MMDAIYPYILLGFHALDLSTVISEVLDPQILIYLFIFSNVTIYHENRGLLLINNGPIRFSDISENRQVLFRIIRALGPEQYDDQTKQWMIKKCTFDQEHHPEYHSPQNIQHKRGPNMHHGYGQHHGPPQDLRKAPADPNPPKSSINLFYLSLDHASPKLHEPGHLGDQLQTNKPFSARFPTPHEFKYSNPSITIGSSPRKHPNNSPYPSSYPPFKYSLGLPTRHHNRHGVHVNDDQKYQGYNCTAALKLILGYFNKQDRALYLRVEI